MKTSLTSSETGHGDTLREVRYRYSQNFPKCLRELGATLLISTYQAGKLVALSAVDGQLVMTFHNFDQPMGIAQKKDRITVGTRSQVWDLLRVPELTPLSTEERCDAQLDQQPIIGSGLESSIGLMKIYRRVPARSRGRIRKKILENTWAIRW